MRNRVPSDMCDSRNTEERICTVYNLVTLIRCSKFPSKIKGGWVGFLSKDNLHLNVAPPVLSPFSIVPGTDNKRELQKKNTREPRLTQRRDD